MQRMMPKRELPGLRVIDIDRAAAGLAPQFVTPRRHPKQKSPRA